MISMSMHEDKVFAVFREVLDLLEGRDRTTLVYNETAGWDSIGHMTIVAGLEESFDCMLDTDDILDMSSFGKAVEIMANYDADS